MKKKKKSDNESIERKIRLFRAETTIKEINFNCKREK
jgi:hypothetical protein